MTRCASAYERRHERKDRRASTDPRELKAYLSRRNGKTQPTHTAADPNDATTGPWPIIDWATR